MRNRRRNSFDLLSSNLGGPNMAMVVTGEIRVRHMTSYTERPNVTIGVTHDSRLRHNVSMESCLTSNTSATKQQRNKIGHVISKT